MNKRYAPQLESSRVVIESVDGDSCNVYDINLGHIRRLASATPSGLTPLVGDIWSIDRSGGTWGLTACLERAVEGDAGSLSDVFERLTHLGLIKWNPDTRSPSQSAHLAYVGEIRLFHITVHPSGWVACDSALIPISRWRRLFREIGTTHGGDGITTFATPTIVPPHASTHWLMCAE